MFIDLGAGLRNSMSVVEPITSFPQRLIMCIHDGALGVQHWGEVVEYYWQSRNRANDKKNAQQPAVCHLLFCGSKAADAHLRRS